MDRNLMRPEASRAVIWPSDGTAILLVPRIEHAQNELTCVVEPRRARYMLWVVGNHGGHITRTRRVKSRLSRLADVKDGKGESEKSWF
jgi:hypothetical protein